MTERLAVVLYDEVAGHLERAGTDVMPTFTYTDDYVGSGTIPLSLRLPIGSRTYPAGRVEPYLRGLLPENPQTLGQWADRLNTTADDIFGILAEMGWDCPGAVQFCAPERLEELRNRGSQTHPVGEAEIAERLRRLVDQPATWSMPAEHWSLGGQQEKFALTSIDGQWYEARGSAATTHIVKPGIKALLHQALIEHVTMAAAAELAVDVASSRMLRFEDQWAIVVERFDRVVDGAAVRRIHQEDFCQALGRLPAAKYESRGGPRLSDLVALVRRQLTEPEDDLLALADFAAVNLVAGAPDGHSKNISLLLDSTGSRWIAPLYDLATGLSYDSKRVDRSVALSIGGERVFSRIRRRQWEKMARSLDVPAELMIGRVRVLAERYPDAFETALAAVAEVPGADEVAGRTLPQLRTHCENVLRQLS
ncbi:type II toxin-antitoxin system HipA family toxin [Kribbella solani]|uniref:Serine/threonine-protein kinase HipA n=1 Tax=Kribbella solani TaxID=236067 RepID=A0A841DZF8_9ACTN|nr:type II toxin-antitoxin system HipA family toxin [Kribbella solani]MBB5981567.1 serine/threonine-protein kinase HipA [Kribbella solani]